MEHQTLTVDSFDGGMVDEFIGAPKNCFEAADNLFITDEKKLKTRPGTTAYDAVNFQPVANRIGNLINTGEGLVARSAKNLYRQDGTGAWLELTGPTSSHAFAAGDTNSVCSHTKWRGQVLIATDSFSLPVKTYVDSGSTRRLVTAGLPALASTPATAHPFATYFTLAGDIKTKFNAHIADTSYHKHAHTSQTQQVSSLSENSLWALWDFILDFGQKYVGPYNAAIAHELDTHAGNQSQHYNTDVVDNALWEWLNAPWSALYREEPLYGTGSMLNAIKSHYNNHDSDVQSHNSGEGAHQVTAADVTLPISGEMILNADLKDYIYGFCYYRSYTANGETFEDYGPVTYVAVKSVQFSGTYGDSFKNVGISAVPAISSAENYDTTNTKVKIFRTLGNGTTLYELATLNAGTTTYDDSTTDTVLAANAELYTTGGVLANDAPPAAKSVWSENNVTLYANLKIGSSYYKNRVAQSAPNDFDSVPGSLYDDFEEEVKAVRAARGKHIVLCENKIYRRDGYYDELGRGTVFHDMIDSRAGCVSENSCVVIPQGLVWAGNDGFYYTDGYQSQKISNGLEATYAGYISTAAKQKRIQGKYFQEKNIVVWAIQAASGATDNDSLVVLYLNHGIRPTSVLNKWNITGWAPTAVETMNGKLLAAYSSLGDLMYYDDTLEADGLGFSNVNYIPQVIIWRYKGPAFKLGNDNSRASVYRLGILAKNSGDVSVQPNSINDNDTANTKALKHIRFRGTGLFKSWRRFPARGLRCTTKQMELTNAYTYIQVSDDVGLGTSNGVGIVLGSDRLADWDINAKNKYYISFPNDNYVKQFLVTGRTATGLGYTLFGSLGPIGLTKWQLKGCPMYETLNLQEYSLEYNLLGDSRPGYDNATSGSNV